MFFLSHENMTWLNVTVQNASEFLHTRVIFSPKLYRDPTSPSLMRYEI